jgi:hypothetical protein
VWIQSGVAAGVPAGYGEMLRTLTEGIATGKGFRPNDNVEKIKGAPSTKFADFAWRSAQAWSWTAAIMATITKTDVTTSPFITTLRKAWWCSNTPPKAESS